MLASGSRRVYVNSLPVIVTVILKGLFPRSLVCDNPASPHPIIYVGGLPKRALDHTVKS